MSTPFSYGQLMPSVTKNFGDGPVYEMNAHEYKTLWYAAAAELRRLHEVNQELVEALESTLIVLENEGVTFWSGVQDSARAALASATGGQA